MTDKFHKLFAGNPFAIGTEDGGCRRWNGFTGAPQGWWEQNLNAHLAGIPCGVYPACEGMAHWLCIDWDTGPEDWGYAVNTQKVIALACDATTWIEASRSKGFHLWWFLEDWVPMDLARKAGLAACTVAGAPKREVNPKQFQLEDEQLGNYVRLPYPGMSKGPERDGYYGRTVYTQDKHPLDFTTFVDAAFESRSTLDQVERMAEFYEEPVRVTPKYVATSGDTYEKLRDIARLMWHYGPNDTTDRSAQIYRFARYVVEGGRHTPDELESLVAEFDRKWFDPPKYANRTDGPKRIRELVERVFTE